MLQNVAIKQTVTMALSRHRKRQFQRQSPNSNEIYEKSEKKRTAEERKREQGERER